MSQSYKLQQTLDDMSQGGETNASNAALLPQTTDADIKALKIRHHTARYVKI